jgi:hypothetical protein
MRGKSKTEKIARDIKKHTRHKYTSEESIFNFIPDQVVVALNSGIHLDAW